MGLFSAVGFGSPTLIDRTAFAGWPDLTDEQHDLTVSDRNKAITADWLEWLDRTDRRQTFFGFVYYDPPMDDMTTDPGEPLPMDDRFTHNDKARELWRQYRLAMRMVDGEVKTVLNALRDRGLEERYADHRDERSRL